MCLIKVTCRVHSHILPTGSPLQGHQRISRLSFQPFAQWEPLLSHQHLRRLPTLKRRARVLGLGETPGENAKLRFSAQCFLVNDAMLAAVSHSCLAPSLVLKEILSSTSILCVSVRCSLVNDLMLACISHALRLVSCPSFDIRGATR